jgi:hypothetical protein
MRVSPLVRCRASAVSSVEPSSTTTISKSCLVCARTERIVDGSVRAAL